MDTYTITLKRSCFLGLFTKRTILTNVKGNSILTDMPHSMLVIFSDDRQEIINLSRYDSYELSKELFLLIAKRATKEGQGQISINGYKN